MVDLSNAPSISEGKVSKMVYARLFIPYTINGWYVMGADKLDDDYKLYVVEKWNTPLVLRLNAKEVLLSELLNRYDTVKWDTEWSVKHINELFSNVKGL